MSIKETPARKKKSKITTKSRDEITDWLDKLDVNEITSNNTQTEAQEEVSHQPVSIKKEPKIKQNEQTISQDTKQIVQSEIDIFIAKLPNWISRPWMFIKPVNLDQIKSWVDSWQSVILSYSRIMKLHVLNTIDLGKKYPFTNPQINKNLTHEQMEYIIDEMIKKGLAKWMDDHKIIARIYYKTNEEWAEIILDYLIETGYAAEILTFFELENLHQEWSSLPREELVSVFEILVEKNRASWIGDDKDTISIQL